MFKFLFIIPNVSNILIKYWNDLPLAVKLENFQKKAKIAIRKLIFNFQMYQFYDVIMLTCHFFVCRGTTSIHKLLNTSSSAINMNMFCTITYHIYCICWG